jgi:hypothetical protein
VDENWDVLTSFFPPNWKELAFKSGAMTRIRKMKSEEALLRTLLLHVGSGYSLRETVRRAKEADIADFSDVALLKRLKKSGQWFYLLCLSLFEEQGVKVQETGNWKQDNEDSTSISLPRNSQVKLRLFDALNVKEPGKTGGSWKVHYSLNIPSLECDFFKLSEFKDKEADLFPYPIRKNDHIITDNCAGIHELTAAQAFVTFEINPQMSCKHADIYKPDHKVFPFLEEMQTIEKAGKIKSWDVQIYENGPEHEHTPLKGRLCALRKTEAAIKLAHAGLKSEAVANGAAIASESYEFAKYSVVFTTFPEENFSSFDVLECYCLSWQLRPVLKRFKELAQIGHLPKYDDESSKAWFYGKLFVALLMEKMERYAHFVSPWGYGLLK